MSIASSMRRKRREYENTNTPIPTCTIVKVNKNLKPFEEYYKIFPPDKLSIIKSLSSKYRTNQKLKENQYEVNLRDSEKNKYEILEEAFTNKRLIHISRNNFNNPRKMIIIELKRVNNINKALGIIINKKSDGSYGIQENTIHRRGDGYTCADAMFIDNIYYIALTNVIMDYKNITNRL